MALVLFDTNAVVEIRRGNQPHFTPRANGYVQQHGQIPFSIITRYEILRGLYATHASKQIALFENFCLHSEVVPLSDDIAVRAAEVYGDLARGGQLIGDADILIAATALVVSRPIVTANVSHFRRIPGLIVQDWTQP